MEKVYVDFDGVILDFVGALKIYLKTKGIDFNTENIETYSFGGDIGCDKKVVFDAMKDFELYKYIYELDNSFDGLTKLRSVADVHAYTGVVDDETIRKIRQDVIHNLGFKDEPLSTPKPVFDDGFAVFDDCPSVLFSWWEKDKNTKLFLIDHTYNRELDTSFPSSFVDSIIRCKTFNDAVEIYMHDYAN